MILFRLPAQHESITEDIENETHQELTTTAQQEESTIFKFDEPLGINFTF